MAHRSTIGVLNKDGTVTYVFCHWGGLPKHQLPILEKHYTNVGAVRKLLSKGGMSMLRTTAGWNDEVRPEGPLYHIERGDVLDIGHAESMGQYVRAAHGMDAEFAYVFVLKGRTIDGVTATKSVWWYRSTT